MSSVIKKKRKLISMKKKLQRSFLEQARAEGLTAAQTVARASIFPEDEKPRVVRWPKF